MLNKSECPTATSWIHSCSHSYTSSHIIHWTRESQQAPPVGEAQSKRCVVRYLRHCRHPLRVVNQRYIVSSAIHPNMADVLTPLFRPFFYHLHLIVFLPQIDMICLTIVLVGLSNRVRADPPATTYSTRTPDVFNITSSADVEAATSAFTSVPLSEWPSALQSQASVYPTGSFPPSNFTPSPINRPVIDSITFCANGQCSGGPDTDVTVPWADFALALPCAKAALNGSGPGFIFADGWLGSCELHWFASASCVDEIG